jgi:HAE1 family hydrophobic/amphiphilic exporter-1
VAVAIALIPQAVGSGPGAAFRTAMAIVTIAGVLVAAVLTLFLIPVIYVKLDRFAFAAHAHERDEREHAGGQVRTGDR